MNMDFTSTRRTFALRLGSVLSALGFTAAAGATHAVAQGSQDANAIRKLNSEGKPGGEKDVIMPVIVHNGLIYVSGQGAHDTRDQKEWTIESHTTMVMDKIKKHVEIGGGTMDTVLQANVFLVKIEHWDGMHKSFRDLFPTRRARSYYGCGGCIAGRLAGRNQLHCRRCPQVNRK